MTDLGAYLRAAAVAPWNWGHRDCCTFMAGWVMERGYSDPMAFIRGAYDSERSALRRIREGGGLVPLWSRGMDDAGATATDAPAIGDVGILKLKTDDGEDECCGIFVDAGHGRWVCRMVDGIIGVPAIPIKAWRL